MLRLPSAGTAATTRHNGQLARKHPGANGRIAVLKNLVLEDEQAYHKTNTDIMLDGPPVYTSKEALSILTVNLGNFDTANHDLEALQPSPAAVVHYGCTPIQSYAFRCGSCCRPTGRPGLYHECGLRFACVFEASKRNPDALLKDLWEQEYQNPNHVKDAH